MATLHLSSSSRWNRSSPGSLIVSRSIQMLSTPLNCGWPWLHWQQDPIFIPLVSSCMFGHRGVGQVVRHLRISGWFDGGFSDWRAFLYGWALQTSLREVDHHPRGSSFCGVCGFCSGVQPAAVTSWCPPQELQFPAPSSLCSAYSSVWRSPCGWSWTKGPSSTGPGHQTSWWYDRLISDFHQAERSQDQHEDVIQEDGS